MLMCIKKKSLMSLIGRYRTLISKVPELRKRDLLDINTSES